MKKFVGLILIGVVLFMAVSCEDDSSLIMVVFAGTESPATGQSRAMHEMAEILNDSGRFKVAVHVSGALSSNTDDLVTQARTGVPLVIPSDPGRLASQFSIPDMNILMAPYVLTDPDILPHLPETAIFQEWEALLEAQGVTYLAGMFNGFRSFYTINPVRNVSDLRGLRIRGFGNDIGNALGKYLGFANIGIPWGEVLPGIQQKTLDGAEIQVATAYGSAIFDVAKNLALTKHYMLQSTFVCSTAMLDKMPDEDREFFLTTIRETVDKYSHIIAEEEIEFYNRMRERGVIITEVDLQEFENAIAPMFVNNDLNLSPGLKDRLLAELGL